MTAVLIAGGGTGGHVFPSLAVADALRAASPDLDIRFVGTARGLESRLVPAAGWDLLTVETPPLLRQVSPRLATIPLAVVRAARRVAAAAREVDAAAALVFGGYVSVPLVLAARRLGLPLVVHEQNAVPGVANRLAARRAVAVAVTFPGTRVRTRGRIVVTGNPVRAAIADPESAGGRAAAHAALGLEPGRTTLLAFGGSQGARRINQALLEAAPRLGEPASLQILHLPGQREHAAVAAAWEEVRAAVPGLHVVCQPFLDRMELAYTAADVVVARSGASTLAELTVCGLPAVLVPYPHATADHQTANAAGLEAVGGAIMVADADLDGATLTAALQPLLSDAAVRARMAQAARGIGRPDAAAAVARLVLEAMPPAAGGAG